MADTLLRRRKDKLYGVGATGGEYVAVFDTGSMVAWDYLDGVAVEEIAETSDLGGLPWQLAAGRYLLAPGSADPLAVWDLEENAVATYTPPAGWVFVAAAALGEVVYWIERPDTLEWPEVGDHVESEVRLRSAGFDLATPVTEATATIETNHAWFWWDDPAGFIHLTVDSVIGGDLVDDHQDQIGAISVRFPLVGGSVTFEEDEGPAPWGQTLVGFAEAGGQSIGALFSNVGSRADDATAAVVENWPLDAVWEFINVRNVSLNLAGTEAAAFGPAANVPNPELDGPAVVRNPPTGASSTALKRFAVEAATEELTEPDRFFIRS